MTTKKIRTNFGREIRPEIVDDPYPDHKTRRAKRLHELHKRVADAWPKRN